VALISGGVKSGGSFKNWWTAVEENTVIRMKIPELCIEDVEDVSIEMRIIDKKAS